LGSRNRSQCSAFPTSVRAEQCHYVTSRQRKVEIVDGFERLAPTENAFPQAGMEDFREMDNSER
jgi:hypothetical protein